jgi:hypothetical protein
MKKVFIFLVTFLIALPCYAQCVAEIKDVRQDEARGSIIVETEYTLNGVVVDTDTSPCTLEANGKYEITICDKNGCRQKECVGRTRYIETSGTNAEIIAKAKEAIEKHCKNLIRRIEANETYRKAEMLKQQKALTAPIITDIKDDLVGEKKTVTEVTDSFKGKDIKVTYDEKNTTSDTVP